MPRLPETYESSDFFNVDEMGEEDRLVKTLEFTFYTHVITH